MRIRGLCLRIFPAYTGSAVGSLWHECPNRADQDKASHAEMGHLDMRHGPNDDLASATMSSTHVSMKETAAVGSLAWHTAPVRQLVITLTGTLVFNRTLADHRSSRRSWLSRRAFRLQSLWGRCLVFACRPRPYQ